MASKDTVSVQNSTSKPTYQITPVRTQSDLEATILLFRAYAKSLDLDLSFQSFDKEVSDMPGRYAPSEGGELLLARDTTTNEPVGCAALRQLHVSPGEDYSSITSAIATTELLSTPRVAEIKRLYTTPTARGSGLGSRLAQEIVQVAQRQGYDEIKLDTLPTMVAAQNLYRRLGFVDVEPYCFNPVEGTRFLGLKLVKDDVESSD